MPTRLHPHPPYGPRHLSDSQGRRQLSGVRICSLFLRSRRFLCGDRACCEEVTDARAKPIPEREAREPPAKTIQGPCILRALPPIWCHLWTDS